MPAEWKPAKKKCLLIPSGTANDPDRHHLFVILTDRCVDGFHLAVSVSSIKDGIKHDDTCLLDSGCHEFITKHSFVMYGRIQKLRSESIEKCVGGWVYKPKQDLSDDQFVRIAEGVATSPFTPRWAKTYFKDNP